MTCLDALRFIAAAAVVFQHVAEVSSPGGAALVGLLSPGVFGVVLFFLVSGYVIPMAARGRFELSRFAIRRLFRIYPLVLVTFALLALAGFSGAVPAFAYVRAASLFDWLANLFLVQDYTGAKPLWGVTWTLSLEVGWYALFALSLMIWGEGFHRRLAIAVPLALLVLALLSVASGVRLPFGRLGMIYAAMLGCRLYHGAAGGIPQARLLLDVAVFLLVMALCNGVAFGHFRHPNITLNQALVPWLVAPLLFAAVILVPAVRGSRLFSSRTLAWLGSISFSTYLLHPLAIGLAERMGGGFIPVALVLTLLLSALGYYLVELPGQKLGAALSRRRVPEGLPA
ncbi:acyltransferase family protein [Azorhizobium oxalatiphilum]|uniref:acyltransferase family protein n=1 Tax=Azorhizobium oxalatiphilum TaxID=980631 RepID=UPI00166631EA|nr:acyltransferase [Azorhizobium oxalatiphilum]